MGVERKSSIFLTHIHRNKYRRLLKNYYNPRFWETHLRCSHCKSLVAHVSPLTSGLLGHWGPRRKTPSPSAAPTRKWVGNNPNYSHWGSSKLGAPSGIYPPGLVRGWRPQLENYQSTGPQPAKLRSGTDSHLCKAWGECSQLKPHSPIFPLVSPLFIRDVSLLVSKCTVLYHSFHFLLV